MEPVLTAVRATGAEVANTFMAGPTPGDDNGVGTLGLVADTQFSVDRGFYDAAQSVAITTTTPGATIRYTTDGSRADAHQRHDVLRPDEYQHARRSCGRPRSRRVGRPRTSTRRRTSSWPT